MMKQMNEGTTTTRTTDRMSVKGRRSDERLKGMKNLRIDRIAYRALLVLGLLAAPALLKAQGGGLEIPGEVEIEYSRTITLPPTRKVELFDTTVYILPPGDSLIFGERITNLEGDGGSLPVYGEFDNPLVLNAEASIGTFISPRGRVALEYAVDRWNARALLDLRSTAGHVDGAEANGILVEGDFEYQVPQGELPSPGKARFNIGLAYQGDGYSLYGEGDTANPASVPDRQRTGFDLQLGMQSETDALFDYAIGVDIRRDQVSDDPVVTGGNSLSASVLSPRFNGDFRYGTDSLNVGIGLAVQPSLLNYSDGTGILPSINDPEFYSAQGVFEWSPAKGLYLSAGGILAYGTSTDSVTSTLIMPMGGIRYALNRNLALFARFSPQLRAPSYHNRMMQVPYAESFMSLRPEKATLNGAGGVRIDIGNFGIEGEALFEQAENSPALVAATGPTGTILAWDHVDSRTIGLHGLIRADAGERIDLLGEVTIARAVDRASDQQLPMHPGIEARARVDLGITDKLDAFGSLLFQSEQNTRLNQSDTDPTLDPRFLLGGGASYQIIEKFQLFAEVTNLLSLGYQSWLGYEAPGLELRVGGRGRF